MFREFCRFDLKNTETSLSIRFKVCHNKFDSSIIGSKIIKKAGFDL